MIIFERKEFINYIGTYYISHSQTLLIITSDVDFNDMNDDQTSEILRSYSLHIPTTLT